MKNRKSNFWDSLIKENSVLNPVDRISEVLFGLIMVLTFTGTISVTGHGREEVSDLLWAALACNLAWGLVDAIMYLMSMVVERGHAINVIQRLDQTKKDDVVISILKEEIQPLVSKLLTEEELLSLASRIQKIAPPTHKNLLSISDFVSAIQIFLLVFLCTLPVALPFALVDDLALALKISNGVAIGLLFVGGFILAKYAGFRPLLSAVIYAIIGIALVLLTMSLGG